MNQITEQEKNTLECLNADIRTYIMERCADTSVLSTRAIELRMNYQNNLLNMTKQFSQVVNHQKIKE